MSYIHIKLSDIEIPNSFRVYCKADGGSNSPYPISGATWTDYGQTYSGGTTEVMLSGSSGVYDFQYSTTYWVKLEEIDYPERYVIKNIRINSLSAYSFAPAVSPSISPSRSVTPTRPVASVTRTPSPTRSITPSISITSTPGTSVSLTPSRSVGASASPTATRTPSISISASMPAGITVYFNDDGYLGISGITDQSLSVIFRLRATAIASVESDCGSDGWTIDSDIMLIQNSTLLHTESITATAPPNGTDSEYSEDTVVVYTIVSGSTVNVYAEGDCHQAGYPRNCEDGSSFAVAQIMDVTITSGTAVPLSIGYYNSWSYSHYHTGVECTVFTGATHTSVTPTPTPSSMPQSPTPTPTPSPEAIFIDLSNQAEDYAVVANMRINGVYVTNWSPSLPYYPSDGGTARSPLGSGVYTLEIEVNGSSPVARRIDLYDSDSTYKCVTIPAYTNGWFTFTNVHTAAIPTTILVRATGYGICPSPSLSVSRTVTPSRTPSTSYGSTPTASVTASLTPIPLSPTPTPSATVFGYNVDLYYCAFPTCEYFIGSAWIENSSYLQVGYYYIYDTNYIYYITNSSSPGGDVTNVSGPGYSTCNQACSNT